MDPSTPLPNPNPGNHGPGVYQIGGVPVEFPYKPYGSQLAFMGRVISTLDRARRQGRCSALLESPTGTGKTLSLLCSSLAWQRNHQQRFLSGPPAPSQLPTPATAAPDHLVYGGGFIPESQPPSNAEETPMPATARAQRRQTSPKIYYASRTHSQISQVIRELRKTSYHVPMAILASRKHYCTNKHVCSSENLDEECKLLLKDEGQGCSEFKNATKVKSHPSLQKGGCYEVHDIEDLVKVGRSVKGCSYFAAQAMAEEAQIVFCPYSYIVNPIVRRAMDIDLKGSVVILDEAHNIEDIARDAGSLDVEEDVLFALQTELGQLCMTDNGAVIYQPLHDMIQGIICWIGDRKVGLQKCEFERYSSFWTGGKAMNELQQAGITQQYFLILQECATKAIKAAHDAESVGNRLSGMSVIALEGLVSSLSYLFSGNGSHAVDYQLALQRYVKRNGNNAVDGWICKLSLWCLNPAVVFKEIAKQVLSVILTSGTLSPMGSFASELGMQFETCMEAPHIIDTESQLWAAVLPTGPANCQLNASYKTADGYAFQDGLGVSLEEICKIAPGGILVFFPSYKLLEKVHHRWNQTGQWSRLNAQKSLFVEPRGAGDEFESVLKGYYDAIHGDTTVVQEKSRLGLKRGSIKHPSNKVRSKDPPRGAAFLAVFRGKVSEGINFSDENARVVVIVGIPFPNKNDIQVVLKKKYNDAYRSSKHLLSGSDWYCHQAFRALNQAAGRCIRHRSDYGAIILLDERFREERNLMYISKWLKNSIKHYTSFDESLVGLKLFFQTSQKQFGPKSNISACEAVSQSKTNFDCGDSTPSHSKSNLNQSIQKQNIMEVKVSHQKSSKIINEDEAASTKLNKLTKSSKLGEKGTLWSLKDCYNDGGKAGSDRNVKSPNCCYGGSVDLESSNLKCNESMPKEHCETISKMPEVSERGTTSDHNASPRKVLKFKNLHQAVDNFDQYLERPSFSPSTFSNGTISEGTPAYSPERMECIDTCNQEKEISLNMSVTSHNQKKRKLIDLSNHEIDYFSSDTDSFYPVDSVSCISRETDRVTESPCPDNYSRNQHQRPRQGMLRKNEFHISMSNFSKEKKLKLCCLLCRKQLGLYENDFLVNCSLSSSSKFYLAYVLMHGPPKDSNLDCNRSALETDVPVVVCDTSSVDHRIFDRENKEISPQKGIWSEEDGCVFRIVTCPYCTVPKTCLGVQIIAVNSSNIHLLNKVLFYADHLEMNNDETEKGAIAICLNVNSQGSALSEIEKYAYSSLPQKLGFLNERKPKFWLCSSEAWALVQEYRRSAISKFLAR